MKSVKGYTAMKTRKRANMSGAESLVGAIGLVDELKNIKSDLLEQIDSKFEQVDKNFEEIKEEATKAIDKVNKSVSSFESSAVEAIKDIKKIPHIKGEPGKDGNTVDREDIANYVLDQIPPQKAIDEDGMVRKVLSKIPQSKASLKVIQERIEIDPMSVIDKIMELPEEKRRKLRLGTDNISGLDQTIRAFQSQLGRGYLHGGGLSTVSHDSTLTGNGTPTDPLHVVDSGGGTQKKAFVTVGNTDADYIVSNYADFGAAVNAAYSGLPSAGGMIWIDSDTYSFSTPIVFGTNGKIPRFCGAGAGSTFLKFTPTSGNAITVNCGNPTGHLTYEITGFTLMGKSTLIAAGQANTNTSVGIYYGGGNGAVGVNTHDMNVNGFGSNWEIGSNAYMLNFQNFSNSGGNGGQAARGALVHINTASNSGERNNFVNGNFTDPGNSNAVNAIYITNAGTASNAFNACSLDNAQIRIGASDGQTSLIACHIENPGSPSSYPEYIPILGVSSDSSTQITVIACEFANSASNRTWTTIIRHGGQLCAVSNHIDNYNGATVTNFVLHDLNNGTSSDNVSQTQVQGGSLTNVIGGSGSVGHSRATGVATLLNVSNSYTIGLRPNGNNTNEFFSGGVTAGTYDHEGDWTIGSDTNSVLTVPGKGQIYNFNTILDASQFSGADIGAKINAAYAYIGTLSLNGAIITVPAGTYSFSTPIVFGTLGRRVSLRGAPGGGTNLSFTGGASTTAITINTGEQNSGADHTSYEAVKDITLTGDRRSTTNPEIGIYCGGSNGSAGAVLSCVNITGFGRGLELGQHNYHFKWDSGVIKNCGRLIHINAANDSGEAIHFYNGFFVDPFDATYAAADGVYIDNSGVASLLFSGCSFDDCQVHILQANNVTFVGCHWENPGSANWGAYTYLTIDNNLATNVSINGDVFFATGSTSPTAYISTGGNVTMNGVIVRKFTGSTMTNFAALTGSGRISWMGFNNVSGTAITNVVSGVAYTPNGFANQAGNNYTMNATGQMFMSNPANTTTAIATVDGTQTFTNKTLTSPTVNGITNGTGLAAGTYTPTLTNVTNISASTAYLSQWMRVGNVVTVSGKVDIDTTLAASTATELGISLPVASNFTAEENLGGTAASDSIASLVARIKADATNDRASFVMKSISLTNDSYAYTFTYVVL